MLAPSTHKFPFVATPGEPRSLSAQAIGAWIGCDRQELRPNSKNRRVDRQLIGSIWTHNFSTVCESLHPIIRIDCEQWVPNHTDLSTEPFHTSPWEFSKSPLLKLPHSERILGYHQILRHAIPQAVTKELGG